MGETKRIVATEGEVGEDVVIGPEKPKPNIPLGETTVAVDKVTSKAVKGGFVLVNETTNAIHHETDDGERTEIRAARKPSEDALQTVLATLREEYAKLQEKFVKLEEEFLFQLNKAEARKLALKTLAADIDTPVVIHVQRPPLPPGPPQPPPLPPPEATG